MTQLLSESLAISPEIEAVVLPAKPAAPRFLFIDGLRGIAACCVMAFHFLSGGTFYQVFHDHVPHMMTVAGFGFLGVDIFFVLSGFVIAFSVRNERVDGRFIRGFVARRWLRLDPPYLVTIGLTLLLLWYYNSCLHMHHTPMPTIRETLANVFYLTGVLKMQPMLPVFWTLCLEVQFYLLFIFAMWAGRLTGDPLHRQLNWISCSLLGVLGLCSIAVIGGWVRRFDGWFINDWNLFFLGCLLWWTIDRKISWWWLIGYSSLLMFASIHTGNYAGYTGLLTMSAIAIAAMMGGLGTWLSNRPVQFLGRISYSLYLLHPLIGPQIDGYVAWHLPGSLTASLLCVGFSIAVSIGAAWLMYRFVEVPGIALGKRLRATRSVKFA